MNRELSPEPVILPPAVRRSARLTHGSCWRCHAWCLAAHEKAGRVVRWTVCPNQFLINVVERSEFEVTAQSVWFRCDLNIQKYRKRGKSKQERVDSRFSFPSNSHTLNNSKELAMFRLLKVHGYLQHWSCTHLPYYTFQTQNAGLFTSSEKTNRQTSISHLLVTLPCLQKKCDPHPARSSFGKAHSNK